MRVGPLLMLVLQPTPFCNIDCDYCYLMNRSDRSRMPMDVVAAAFKRSFDSGLISDEHGLDVLWHAGEPLVVGKAFYQEASRLLADANTESKPVRQIIQTNGMLIDQDWCHLFLAEEIQIGVSIDGPADVHDRHRVDRRGGGTFAKVMAGVDQLKRHSIQFSAMGVLTKESLRDADRLLDFFEDIEAIDLAFNLEEEEPNKHKNSFHPNDNIIELYNTFLEKAYARHSAGKLRIREINAGLQRWEARSVPGTARVRPLELATVGYDGGFSTFCPELHGVTYSNGARHVFGNILQNDLLDIFSNPSFLEINDSIIAGVRRCAETCSRFNLCGSQRVGVKYFTHGTFDADETLYCRTQIKGVADFLDRTLTGNCVPSQSAETAIPTDTRELTPGSSTPLR